MNAKIKVLLSACALFLAGAASGGIGAQLVQPCHGEPQFGAGRFKEGKFAEHIEERLTEKLKLTDDQRSQVRSILQTTGEKAKVLREEQRGKWRELMDGNRAQIRAILTPEQQAQFDTFKRPGKGMGRRHGGWRKHFFEREDGEGNSEESGQQESSQE